MTHEEIKKTLRERVLETGHTFREISEKVCGTLTLGNNLRPGYAGTMGIKMVIGAADALDMELLVGGKAVKSVEEAVDTLIGRIRATGQTFEDVGEKCYMSGRTLSKWQERKNCPQLDCFLLAADAVGADVTLAERA